MITSRESMQAVVDKLERVHDWLQPIARYGLLNHSGILWPTKADRIERRAYFKACETVRECARLVKAEWGEKQESWL